MCSDRLCQLHKKSCHYKLSTFSPPGHPADNVLGGTESEETDLDKTLIIGVFLVLVCLAGLLCVLVQSFISGARKDSRRREQTVETMNSTTIE